MNTNPPPVTIGTILSEATVLAASANLREFGITYPGTLDLGKLADAVRETLLSSVDEILEEWNSMLGLSEWATREALNLQANVYGKKAALKYLQPAPA